MRAIHMKKITRKMLAMREPLPDRRRSWTQKVRIGGQVVYLCVGEYDDGRPGEIFVDVAKAGTFLRGVMGQLARSLSIALQCGADVATIIHMLREHDYPPNGLVTGSPTVDHCCSVTDWMASELEAQYINKHPALGEGDVPPMQPSPAVPEKVAGYIAEEWRTGV